LFDFFIKKIGGKKKKRKYPFARKEESNCSQTKFAYVQTSVDELLSFALVKIKQLGY
jgi:hypothetical protein